MNKTVSNCLGKEQYSEKEIKHLNHTYFVSKNRFYKCPMCGKYHLTSRKSNGR